MYCLLYYNCVVLHHNRLVHAIDDDDDEMLFFYYACVCAAAHGVVGAMDGWCAVCVCVFFNANGRWCLLHARSNI